jgi:glycolate oxidase
LNANPATDHWLAPLSRALGDSKLLTGSACEAYTTDDSNARGLTPSAVVFAESTADIEKTFAVASEHRVAVTPRGAGTGRVGGATTMQGGIVLCTVGMNQIRELDRKEQTVVVAPGLVLEDLQQAVEGEGLFYPPDPSSQATCTLGGNVATNAGGPRAFKYGVTRNYVLGMDVTLPTGETFFAGRRTRKGVTGYDVAGLVVGSEGTLAVVGDITLQLVKKPAEVMTLLALFDNVHHAGACVEAMIARGLRPRCIELLDEPTLQAVRAAGNPIDQSAKAMLLVEIDGEPQALEHELSLLEGVCQDVKAQHLLVAQDAAQRDRLWSARRQMSHAVRRLSRHKLSEDVVVPRKHIGTLLEFVARVSEQTGIAALTYGHAGDGNLHCNYLWNDDAEVPLVQLSISRLFERVVALGGTLSGEHGIGILKAPYLPLEQSSALISLQQRLKHSFDPHGILNPGKIFPQPSGHGAC